MLRARRRVDPLGGSSITPSPSHLITILPSFLLNIAGQMPKRMLKISLKLIFSSYFSHISTSAGRFFFSPGHPGSNLGQGYSNAFSCFSILVKLCFSVFLFAFSVFYLVMSFEFIFFAFIVSHFLRVNECCVLPPRRAGVEESNW